MNSKMKSTLLGIAAMAAMGEGMMNAPVYRFKGEVSKTPLTPKQRKSRKKSKAAKKARRAQR